MWFEIIISLLLGGILFTLIRQRNSNPSKSYKVTTLKRKRTVRLKYTSFQSFSEKCKATFNLGNNGKLYFASAEDASVELDKECLEDLEDKSLLIVKGKTTTDPDIDEDDEDDDDDDEPMVQDKECLEELEDKSLLIDKGEPSKPNDDHDVDNHNDGCLGFDIPGSDSVTFDTVVDNADRPKWEDKQAEFQMTIITDNEERYLRQILLLGKGGCLVLRALVNRERDIDGRLLEDILTSSKTQLQKCLLKFQFNYIFPLGTDVNADIETWDISLLISIILNIFGHVTLDEKDALNEIREIRNKIQGHHPSYTLTEEDYNELGFELNENILKLASDKTTKIECYKIISYSGAGQLTNGIVLKELNAFHAFEGDQLSYLNQHFRKSNSEFEHIGEAVNEVKAVVNTVIENQHEHKDELAKQVHDVHVTALSSQEYVAGIKDKLDTFERNDGERNAELTGQLQIIHTRTNESKQDIKEIKDERSDHRQMTRDIGLVQSHMRDDVLETKSLTKETLDIVTETVSSSRERNKQNVDRLRRIEQMLIELSSQQSGQHFQHDVDVNININSERSENVTEAQDIIITSLNDILKEIRNVMEDRDNAEAIMQKVDKLLLREEGRDNELTKALLELIKDIIYHGHIQQARKGSIKLTVRFTFYSELLSFLQYLSSEKFQDCLNDICRALENRTGNVVTLSGNIAQESLYDLHTHLEEECNNLRCTRSAVLPVQCKGIVDLNHIWKLLQRGGADIHMKRLSEILTKIVGGKVILTTSVNLKKLEQALLETESEHLSSENLCDDAEHIKVPEKNNRSRTDVNQKLSSAGKMVLKSSKEIYETELELDMQQKKGKATFDLGKVEKLHSASAENANAELDKECLEDLKDESSLIVKGEIITTPNDDDDVADDGNDNCLGKATFDLGNIEQLHFASAKDANAELDKECLEDLKDNLPLIPKGEITTGPNGDDSDADNWHDICLGFDIRGSDSFTDRVVDNADIQKWEDIQAGSRLKEHFAKHGLKDITCVLKENLNAWKSKPLNIAVIGESGKGKSSFINAFLSMSPGQDGAAEIDEEECTTIRRAFCHPKYDSFVLWDVPGVGTKSFPKETYLNDIEFNKYDFFMILSSNRFSALDSWLAEEILRRNRKFYFIRTKIDIDMSERENRFQKRGQKFDKEGEFDKLKSRINEKLKCDIKVKNVQFFMISNHHPTQYDFPSILNQLLKDVPDEKKDVMMFALAGTSKDIIVEKASALKSRLWKVALVSGAWAAIPVPQLSSNKDITLILEEILMYREQLGLDDQSLKHLAIMADISLEQLKSSVKFGTPADVFTSKGLTRYLKKGNAREALDTIVNVTLPIIGPVSLSGLSYHYTMYNLERLLENMKEDALKVLLFVSSV